MTSNSRPSTPPPLSRSDSVNTPGILAGAGMGYFSIPFERFAKDEASDGTSAFTLLGQSN